VADLIDVRSVTKNYGGLRPLRLAALTVEAGDRVAITGVDAPAAEHLVNLLTGATLPDEGEIRLFGRPTSAISDADDWLTTLDRIGMVSPRDAGGRVDRRAGHRDGAHAVARSDSQSPRTSSVARDADSARWTSRRASRTGADRERVAVARSLATSPAVLVLEHANALVPDGAEGFGRETLRW
jgi:predicted ABC-type transport system involved in lysophospholipase L1 biosynthesis ATPase subunit